ncbi:hypothetical protein AQJ54_39400 [Streptomyces griseorubiginosus]|uniref:Uncharacterized protein n=1 Tax=Streptomyces griseorubiginosus TaxID=67304 RepID=A0A117QXB9_9ACTN|nr:hypothetical protein AQJ54_39400 [Streptomyces griseorubiginosus]
MKRLRRLDPEHLWRSAGCSAQCLHGGLSLTAGCECYVSLPAHLLHLHVAQRAGIQAVRHFGEYSSHELHLVPEPYDSHLDVDFSRPHGDSPPGTATYAARLHDLSHYGWARSPVTSGSDKPLVSGGGSVSRLFKYAE